MLLMLLIMKLAWSKPVSHNTCGGIAKGATNEVHAEELHQGTDCDGPELAKDLWYRPMAQCC